MRTFFIFLITAFVLAPTVTFAQKYLVGLPIDNQGNFNQYINLLYKMSISIAALLAVVKIIIAGAKYMLSDIVTNKSEAKKDIQGALLGLLLIIGAVIVLNTINPALTDGGLNIRKMVVPELSVSPAPVTSISIGQEITSEALKAPNMNSCVKQTIVQTAIMYNPLNCPKSLDWFAEEDKFEAWCKTTMKGEYNGTSAGGLCVPAVNLFDNTTSQSTGASQTTATAPAQTPPSSTPVDVNAQITACTKDGGERQQGTVTYHYFDLSTCGQYLNNALTSLRAACSPQAVLNAGNGSYYCRM